MPRIIASRIVDILLFSIGSIADRGAVTADDVVGLFHKEGRNTSTY
jgi:hypothetical protein